MSGAPWQTIYPGSPGILRESCGGRTGACWSSSIQPTTRRSSRFNQVTNLKVLHLDGWTAAPCDDLRRGERAGLVLIDPPYEETNELDRLGTELLAATPEMAERRLRGVVSDQGGRADRRPRGSASTRRCARPGLRLEMLIDDPRDADAARTAAGLLVLNPPSALQQEADLLLPALAERLSRGPYAGFRCEAFGPPA